MATITSLLGEIRDGSVGASDRLYRHVYDDLKDIARQRLRKIQPGALDATALVNAAYERLASKEALDAADRRHLFYLFSRAIHDVLVEQVRADLAEKRGGKLRRVPVMEVSVDGTTRQVDLLDLQDALSDLGRIDPVAAQIVVLRFYGRMSLEDCALAVGLSFAVARRHWDYAKAWMHERLSDAETRNGLSSEAKD